MSLNGPHSDALKKTTYWYFYVIFAVLCSEMVDINQLITKFILDHGIAILTVPVASTIFS